jgi:hypothetical protein
LYRFGCNLMVFGCSAHHLAFGLMPKCHALKNISKTIRNMYWVAESKGLSCFRSSKK